MQPNPLPNQVSIFITFSNPYSQTRGHECFFSLRDIRDYETCLDIGSKFVVGPSTTFTPLALRVEVAKALEAYKLELADWGVV